MSEGPVRYKIKVKYGIRELEVVAMEKDQVEELFDKYKELIGK